MDAGWMRALSAGAIVLGLALPVAAQDEEADEPPVEEEIDPELSDPSIDRIVREMIEAPDAATAIQPRRVATPRPAGPGQVEGPLLPGWEGGAPLLPENSFVQRRRGRLLRLSTGDWVFIFHAGENENAALPPMIVLPCRELERVEGIIDDPSTGGLFEASGRAYVYRGRNYLLPNTSQGLLPSVVAAEPEEESPEETPAPSNVLEPDIAEIVAALEAEREAHRPITPLRTPSPVAEDASGLPREGEMIVRRRGRMTRVPSGQWAFRRDIDAGMDTSLDPALVITPSVNLMLMENMFEKRGEDMVIELTGRMLVYKQRVYVVPLMYQVVREAGINPLQ